MELKEFQREVLTQLATYLDELNKERIRAERAAAALRAADLTVELETQDFPRKAWDALRAARKLPPAFAQRAYSSRFDGAKRPAPNVCFKIPTGGGKTLLASASIARVFACYYRLHTGLVLWIVPNEAIYSQTKKTLVDRDHPYRQMLNVAGAGRVKILEKDSPLSRLDIEGNLCVMLLMLQSAARQSKETLRFFRDRGSVHGFFPREDDLEAHWAMLADTPNYDVYAPFGTSAPEAAATKGSVIKDSLGNVMRLVRPMVIIDEGHHAYTENALKTIDGFNPSFVLELSATPRVGNAGQHGANILVDVRGKDLDRAEMIKLPINVEVKPWPDWQSCLATSMQKLEALEREARALEADTARYIRPMMLVQVERTGAEQRAAGLIHAEDARAYLLQLGLQERQIAVKTSEKDELKQPENMDLLAPACEVRAIITKQALQEGWDCPFAYVLCALAAGRNPAALTQLVGRILRQPQVSKTGRAALDECYVFCHDARTAQVIANIKASLETEGMGDLAVSVRAGDGKDPGSGTRRIHRRPEFEKLRIFLPKVNWREGAERRELVYESDVLARLPWHAIDGTALCTTWAPDSTAPVAQNLRIGLDVLDGSVAMAAPSSVGEPRRIDRQFATRALLDLVPNAWIAWHIIEQVVGRLTRDGLAESAIARSLASLIERLRVDLESQRDTLAEAVFDALVREGQIEFSLRADSADYEIPFWFEAELLDHARILYREDGKAVEKSLFAPFYEPLLDNSFETEFACYADSQAALSWWHRNVAKSQYGLQGWKRNKVYPDFVLAKVPVEGKTTLIVLETKGAYLNNEDTAYKQRLLETLTRIYKDESRARVGELELVSPHGQRVVCDLLFDQAWRGTLAAKHFS
ncbi:MAG: hypothetical protein A3I01_13590 [Betaproteobacteria bacterium RIFCSPLOWO2_02_FULL_65_24]|nr:MAG: hypothetical protein A3I01_13590 [Betaproteobacteria bacterium RIFCSPLOWO2_02_FULL_65_24]